MRIGVGLGAGVGVGVRIGIGLTLTLTLTPTRRGLEGRGALEGRITPLECHASSAAAGAAQLQRRASELQTRRHKLAQLEATFEPNPYP